MRHLRQSAYRRGSDRLLSRFSRRRVRLVRQGASFDEAFEAVTGFLDDVKGEIVALGVPAMDSAHACAARYHHLTGHPARLNMGDCFAYAAARTSGLKLAYKGNDFVHTDVDGVRFGPEAEPARA